MAEGIPLGVDSEEDEVDVVRVEGALEPVQGETSVAQAGVDEGHGVRWDEALTGDGFEGLEDLQCFASAAGFCEDVAAQRQCLGVADAEPSAFVERVEGEIVIAEFHGNLCKMKLGDPELWIDDESLAGEVGCGGIVACREGDM